MVCSIEFASSRDTTGIQILLSENLSLRMHCEQDRHVSESSDSDIMNEDEPARFEVSGFALRSLVSPRVGHMIYFELATFYCRTSMPAVVQATWMPAMTMTTWNLAAMRDSAQTALAAW